MTETDVSATTSTMRAPNVWSISPALPFLPTFARALLDGEMGLLGLSGSGDPLRFADLRIFLPTQRSAAALATALQTAAGASSLVMPRCLPLGALEATEPELIFAARDPAASGLPLQPAATTIGRRLHLAALIRQWSQAVGGAIRTVDAAGRMAVDPDEAFRVSTSSADSFALAGDLARLIDELIIEDVPWSDLRDIDAAAFDDYWRITTTFLAIAAEQWPAICRERGMVDRATRQKALVAAQERALVDGEQTGPVIAIGSTGTNKATAQLLAAIARHPNGAVVLPGLDHALDEASWQLVAGSRRADLEPSFGHPQAALARLLPTLGVARSDVRDLGRPEPARAARIALINEALRPADSTEYWRDWRKKNVPEALAEALAGVSLVEASDEREEALCLALALRETLEHPGRTAALVTPDRELARRVRSELLRWNVEVADSAGEPLAGRPYGVIARLVLAAGSPACGARCMSALLAHPLATFGRERGTVSRLARSIEIGVLRAVPMNADASALFTAARTAAADHHAHPAQKGIRDDDWAAAEALWRDVAAALAPIGAVCSSQDLHHWVGVHRAAIDAVVGSADVSTDEAGALRDILDELDGQADAALPFNLEGYTILFARLCSEAALRNTDRPHPRLQILGLLEARLIAADVMLLGGLDEGVWPPQAQADAFLNRPMREQLGLSSPERRLGQTAHDFVAAMGNSTVVVTRARKRAGSPCVPSRFLLRLHALCGEPWLACVRRGDGLLEMARRIDASPQAATPARRPQPTPPVALRPTRLSVTQIETLRRDPYAIYAAKILKLVRLPEAPGDIDPAAFGSTMHDILQRFCLDARANGGVAERRAALHEIAADAFAPALADPMFKGLRWPAIRKTLAFFLDWDGKQRGTAPATETETDGKLEISLADGTVFTLTARADRLDRHSDGSALLVDYKTGEPPGLREISVGFAPQLTLEAAILRGGGFGAVPRGPIAATYLKLGSKEGGWTRDVAFKDETFTAVVDRHYAGAFQLLSQFRSVETAYPSRPFPKYAKRYSDYDHLARVREWSLAEDEEVAP